MVKPPPRLSVSEWADRFRRLSPESSAEPGQWRTERAPYQRGIMDALRDPRVDEIALMTAGQVGKTEIINNLIGFVIDQDPAPVLVVMPTLELAEAWSKDRLAPMVRDTPCLRDKVADAKTRDTGNTLLHKQFPGGHLTVAGANSPASLASRPIRFVLCDEVDRYPASAGAEGDPVSLAVKRSATFWNRRIVLTSTPGTRGVSRIERAWLESDQRRFFVPCPACGEFQHLRWGQVKWEGDDPATARYVCEACGRELADREVKGALRAGDWRAVAPFNGRAGFHLNELYSPWTPLSATVASFHRAKPHRETLKVWVNTALGEAWEEEGEAPDWLELKRRAEVYELGTVPAGGLLLTAGVDVQDDRVVVVVRAWGRGEESWLVWFEEIEGDMLLESTHEALDRVLLETFRHESGADLRIVSAAIDSGGHRTQAVYAYVRRRMPRVFAVKGSSLPGRPVIAARPSKQDLDWKGERIDGGVALWIVGADTAKGEIYARLRLAEPGPRFVHFPSGIEDEYFEQLTGEKLVTRYQRGVPRLEWLRVRRRQDALDCEVYAYAAALRTGISRVKWDAVERGILARATRPAPPEGEGPPTSPARQRSRLPSVIRSKWLNC